MRSVIVIMLLFLIPLFNAYPSAIRPDDPPYSPELIAHLEAIQAQVSDIRQLPILTTNWGFFLSRASLQHDLAHSHYPSDINDTLNAFYLAFDFIPEQIDFVTLNLEVQSDYLDGYYDSLTGNFFIVLDEADAPSYPLTKREQITYAHEFVHVLQRQHFEIYNIPTHHLPRDASQAVRAFIEGEASFVEQKFARQNNLPPYDYQAIAEELNYPAIFIAEHELVYLEGATFIRHLYQVGGWEQINQVYQRLPAASHHILYPDRYLTENPLHAVPITQVAIVFADPLAWRIMEEDQLGAFFLREYLATQLPYDVIKPILADWTGDRYILYQNFKTDQLAWVLNTAWQTAEATQQFYDLYHTFAEARSGQIASEQPNNIYCWTAPDRVLCLKGNGQDHVTLSNAPTLQEAVDMIVLQSIR